MNNEFVCIIDSQFWHIIIILEIDVNNTLIFERSNPYPIYDVCLCVCVIYIYYCVKMLAFIIIINFDDFVYYNNWFNFSQKYSNALNVDIPCPFEPGNNLINPHAYIKTV